MKPIRKYNEIVDEPLSWDWRSEQKNTKNEIDKSTKQKQIQTQKQKRERKRHYERRKPKR
jgi:hypothetical protein